MNDNNDIISIWQSNKDAIGQDFKLITSDKTKNVMDTIIDFENVEKQEKKKQIYAAVFLFFWTAMLLYNVDLTTSHYIGMVLLTIAVAYGIISNRTDNFPDFRQLNTLEYLKQYKTNTSERTRMHRINSWVGLIPAIPGLYLTFQDSFTILGLWWIPIMVITIAVVTYFWFKHYHERSGNVLQEVNILINSFEEKK